MTSDSSRSIAAIVLAAGKGTRMRSSMPKALQPLGGAPLIHHALAASKAVGASPIVVVIGPDSPEVAEAVQPHSAVVQQDRLGTGHAALQAKDSLSGVKGDVLVSFGDTPFMTAETLELLVAARRQDSRIAVAVLGFTTADPAGYGRLILDVDGKLARIVEERDADDEERAIHLCNGGVMCLDAQVMWDLLSQISSDNARGEYYLTEIVSIANGQGFECVVVEAEETEVMGVDSKLDLANAETILQDRLRDAALEGGVTMTDPSSVYLSADTTFGSDVTIEPNVVFGPGVTVGDNVAIKAFCHIEDATIGDDASVGPFARMRRGAIMGADSHIGNFVEVKASELKSGAKAMHLTYIGDASVGEKANIGAGTITCNYDGFNKHRTEIGDGAFIGSNTALIAPVTVGAGAVVGAGSAINGNVPADSLAVARGMQVVKDGRARAMRAGREKK